MTERRGFCGIDVGTQGVRAMVVDEQGTLLGSGRRPLESDRSTERRHEQDPGEWWDALVGAVRAAVAELPADVHVSAVAIDATSGTVLVEDASGATTGPALMYDDARAEAEAEQAQDAGAELWAELGIRMQTTWALPKALWLDRHADLAATDRIVHQADHLAGRLVGERVPADTSHALKTGADGRDATWPAEVFAELELSLDRLPGLVFPGTVLGRISKQAALELGLSDDVEVKAGMTDGCAGQIAAGALETGSWSSTLGTTLVVKGAVDELIHDPSGAIYSHRHPDGGWLPGGASSSGTGVFAAMLPGQDLDDLTAAAVAREDERRDIPAAYPLAGRGERFPFVAPDAEGFVDGSPDDVDRFVGLCRGLGYVERLAYDALRSYGADVSGPVAFTGGATRNAWLNQLRTDILGRPTSLPRLADPAFGMAVLAAAEPGSLARTASAMVTVGDSLTPDPERWAVLEPGYRTLVDRLAERGWLAGDVAEAALNGSGVAP